MPSRACGESPVVSGADNVADVFINVADLKDAEWP